MLETIMKKTMPEIQTLALSVTPPENELKTVITSSLNDAAPKEELEEVKVAPDDEELINSSFRSNSVKGYLDRRKNVSKRTSF